MGKASWVVPNSESRHLALRALRGWPSATLLCAKVALEEVSKELHSGSVFPKKLLRSLLCTVLTPPPNPQLGNYL